MKATPASLQFRRRLRAFGFLTILPAVFAQQAPQSPPATTPAKALEEEIVELSPFQVNTTKDRGYRATNSISGTRLNTAIKDIPMPIEVITEQFIKDTASYDLRDSLRYSSGVLLQSQNDYGSPGGAYQGPGGVNNPEAATANSSRTSFKIRGFVTDNVLRDGYIRQHSSDSVNISRIEVVRGPAALLYGIGNFGGIINYLPKLPENRQHGSVALSYGSYDFKRAAVDVTGPISPTWDLNYRFNAAWEDSDDYTDYRKSHHTFYSPTISFKPTQTTEVVIDYEQGSSKDEGVGFQRVRSAVGPGPNSDQNEGSSFYTLPGTDRRNFRWSGPDTHTYADSYNFRAQVTQKIGEHFNFLAGYNRSQVRFDKLDVIGNLQGWVPGTAGWLNPPVVLYEDNPAKTTFAQVRFVPIDIANGASSLGLGNLNGTTTAALAYRWTGEITKNDREQVRTELNSTFKMFENADNKWLRMDHMIMLGFTAQKAWSQTATKGTAFNANDEFNWVTNFKNPLDKTPLRFGATQPNGSPELPFVDKRRFSSTGWNQGQYGVYQGQLLDKRLTIVAGARHDRNDTLTSNTTLPGGSGGSGATTSSTVRGKVEKQYTYQYGATFQATREISVYALHSEGLLPNFDGKIDTNGNPLGATEAKSKEVGLKIDLFNGRLTGTVGVFEIKRKNTPVFYWWAPTSNRSRFNPNKDIVYQVNDFRPSSLGGPGNNGAGEANLDKWNAGLAAGAITQIGGNWYVNASKAQGAAFLDGVFDFTKANKFSWPGWLYNSDANTNNTWDNRASGPDGNEFNLGRDKSTGWDAQLMFTPNDNLQIVTTYAHTKREVTSAGTFAKNPFPQDRWAPWLFPNTDWGLTSVPTNQQFLDPNDTSTWQGINWGQGTPLDDTPKNSASVWANYSFSRGLLKGFSFGAGGNYESPRLFFSTLTRGGGQQVTDANGKSVNLKTDSRYTVNAMARYRFDLGDRPASVQVNINNLLNDRKFYGLIAAPPISARVEFAYEF